MDGGHVAQFFGEIEQSGFGADFIIYNFSISWKNWLGVFRQNSGNSRQTEEDGLEQAFD